MSSAIEWTDETWNPVTGCDRISAECKHCWAAEFAPRLRAMGREKYVRARDGRAPTSGPAFGLTLHEDELAKPLGWRRPLKIFVCSMSDLFHEDVPLQFIRRVFDVMVEADHHTFQVLTKRADRLASLAPLLPWPPNVWAGVSIGYRPYVKRAAYLRRVPAAVRWISAEPLLGPIHEDLVLDGIDWVVAGGESGQHLSREPGRFLVDQAGAPRADRVGWVRDLRDACHQAGAAFLFKQWGGRTSKAGGRELDGRVWDEFPGPQLRLEAAA